MSKKNNPGIKKPRPQIIKSFLQGLLVLLPIYLTFWLVFIIIRWVYRFLSIFRKIVPFLPDSIENFKYTDEIFTLIIFVFIFFLIVFIGVMAKTIFGKAIMRFIEKIIKSLPGVNSLYKSIKQLLKTVFPRDNAQSFLGVVLVRFPHKDSWSVAFLTGNVPDNLKPAKNGDYLAVFMPSTPNPTTGFVMIVPKKDVKNMDISVEDAFKVIMSGGLIMEEKKDEDDDD